MRQYTTPTLNITIKYRDGGIASDLDYDYLIFSLRSACYKIDRTIQKEEVIDGVFSITFTQEETAKMKLNDDVEMELNFFKDDTRFASNIQKMRIDRNLLQEVIE